MTKLYVVTCVSNPVRYHSRYALYQDFAKRIDDTDAVLYTVEMAFGDRPFVVTGSANSQHIQLRSKTELWHKENMINLGIQRLPIDWEYVAWVDADITFTRPDWVEETLQQLQHYDMVQMFSHATDLSPEFEPMATHTGFVHNWYQGINDFGKYDKYSMYGHPGYAWAATRQALDAVGGLMDSAILGAADNHMAHGLIGEMARTHHPDVPGSYKRYILEWQDKALKHIKGNIGYVPGTINHFWHGAKVDRKYHDRWKIIIKHNYTPRKDTYHDSQGLLQLSGDKPKLRDDLRKYFRARFEDSDWIGKPHKLKA